MMSMYRSTGILSFDPGVLETLLDKTINVNRKVEIRTRLRALARPVFLRSTMRGSRLINLAERAKDDQMGLAIEKKEQTSPEDFV